VRQKKNLATRAGPVLVLGSVVALVFLALVVLLVRDPSRHAQGPLTPSTTRLAEHQQRSLRPPYGAKPTGIADACSKKLHHANE
jgi:hypothetical protein